jgi:hypothetical protein
MKLFDKIKWVLGVLLVFVLIVATNLIDRDNFRKVSNSVETIYENRLVVKEVLFELSHLIHDKELAATAGDVAYFTDKNSKANLEIDQLMEQFLSTETTKQEAETFQVFQKDIQEVRALEPPTEESMEVYKKKILEVKEGLYKLAKIQVREGRNQMLISRNAMKEVELFTSIEIYLMIFLAIAVQIIIMYRPSE